MTWYEPLYSGLALRGREEWVRSQAEAKNSIPALMLITLAANHKDLLDIIAADTVYRKDPEEVPLIVGIAIGQSEAVCVVENILQDCLKKTGGVDTRKFFTGQGED